MLTLGQAKNPLTSHGSGVDIGIQIGGINMIGARGKNGGIRFVSMA